MKFLENVFKFMFREQGHDNALKDEDDKSLVESVVLEHVVQHLESKSTRLTANHVSQFIR